ncbi:hypothetical protein CGZ80_16325 [Rhodopirellula sp. MGV]|nr:hypothetical protein CGZ80_16325 [Rhodopirellula sp. MGV]
MLNWLVSRSTRIAFVESLRRYRAPLVLTWSAATLCVAAFAVLKPHPSSKELVFLPGWFTSFMDVYYDFRTFIMTVAIGLIPALLLSPSHQKLQRHSVLFVLVGALLIFEFMQNWIPTRGFSWADVGYTVAGGLACEYMARLTHWLRFGAKDETPVAMVEHRSRSIG